MKDLTDFLSSTTKTSKDSNSAATEDEKSNKADKNELKVQNSEDPKTTGVKKKRRKKKIKRKPSDPAVKNIVNLLSNSLCIISPNRTPNDQSSETATQKRGNEQKEKQGKPKEVTIKSDKVLILEENENISFISPKGDTSQGSTTNIGDDGDDHLQSKNKLNAFQFMMESRNKIIGQNSPGKDRLDDDKTGEETEKKEVLSARKNLLEKWANKRGTAKRKREEEEKDEIINHKLKRRAKRLKKLLNVDQSNNVESDSNDVITKTKKRIKRISSSSSEITKDSVLHDQSNGQIIPIVEVIDENAQDKILSESKTKETKQSLLSFFGVANKTKKSETIEMQDDSVDEKRLKLKLNSTKMKKKKSDFNTEEIKHTDESSNDISVKKKKIKCKKNKKHVNETTKTPKNGLKLDNEDSFTPRSTKSWKLKIKINDENIEKDPEEKKSERRPQRSKRVTDYKLLLGDEGSSDEGEAVARKTKSKTRNSVEVIVCSDDESNKKTGPSKPLRVAPVFAKATPKPKLAPEVVEARKQFLMSGIPDSLKKVLEKRQSVEEREYDVFPAISHVQQKCDKPFWDLPKPQLDLKDCSPSNVQKPEACMGLTNSHIADSMKIQQEVEKVDKLKTLLNRIKADNPNYPVYKSFRLICEKSGKKQEVVPKPKKGRKRRSKSIEIVEDFKPIEPAIWTDKYKPKCSDDIIGNVDAVKNLKKWLELWKNFSDEINAKRKRKRGESSDSDFETADCNSRLPGSTIVVAGPCGSGKSTAIYAICNELNFNVIELNASSKRTGKRLLQELQEATQSHQVRKKEQNVQDFFQSKDVKKQTDKKLCVLLMEDVDVVFDQDEGFVSALGQLVSTSKRPIILTTTDPSPAFVQKFISQYEYVTFLPLSSQSLATWLQILCLVEGLLVNQSDIGALLEYNKGDMRKTLLQLQFWVQSGGQIVRDNSLVKMSTKIVTMEQKVADDEKEPVLEEDGKETADIFIHSNCINSFEIFKHHKPYRVPYYLNLGLLWWNLPNILGIRSFSEERIKKFKENHFESSNAEEKPPPVPRSAKLSIIERRKLDSLAKLYDSLAFTDVSFRVGGHVIDLEPGVRNFDSKVKDSLELGENLDEVNDIKDFTHELTHNLVNGYVDEFSRIENGQRLLNIAVPEKAERRWRAKMHVCEDVFLEALPLSTHIERKSVPLDYMPYLRNMSRSECRRAATNNKRGNRFRNYLRTLGINYNDNTLKLACNILIDDL